MDPLLDTDRQAKASADGERHIEARLRSFSSVTTDHAARYDPRWYCAPQRLIYGPRRSISRASGWECAVETTCSAASISAVERSFACSSASSSASS
jgi:hypothetical protein